MKYEILKSYISYCNQNSKTPTFIGLKEYKKDVTDIVEWLRGELYSLIDLFGTADTRTVEKSQELDRALNKESACFRGQTQSN